jgi:hypothetical protein
MSITVPTVSSLKRTRTRLSRNLLSADRVIAAMRNGQALHCSFEGNGERWWLSSGTRVSPAAAKLAIEHPDVVSTGDALFKNVRGQTFRFAN